MLVTETVHAFDNEGCFEFQGTCIPEPPCTPGLTINAAMETLSGLCDCSTYVIELSGSLNGPCLSQTIGPLQGEGDLVRQIFAVSCGCDVDLSFSVSATSSAGGFCSGTISSSLTGEFSCTGCLTTHPQ